MQVAEPQKELRFTRSSQGAVFLVASAISITAAVVFFLIFLSRKELPELPHPAWGILPLALGFWLLKVGHRCVKHAYLILTPLGVEIFPFFRPETGMQLIPWAQITGAEVNDRRLTLHFSPEKTSGIHLSLSPIPAARRELLTRAILGRVQSQ